MPRLYYYAAQIYHAAATDLAYIALLLSRAEALGANMITGVGRTPDAADGELRKALQAALGQECYPLALHVSTAYYCFSCRLVLSTQQESQYHLREKHGVAPKPLG